MELIRKLMTDFRLDLGPVKEPLGFIRVLEWFFTIFAFATTGGYVGSTVITLQCTGEQPKDITANFGYPFRLMNQQFYIPNCNSSTSNKTHLTGDYSSSAEFYVCVGVFAFIYCTFTLILYLGYQHVYRETSRGPVVDLFITGIFAFLWLVSASAWGKGLTDVKNSTNPEKLIKFCNPECAIKLHPAMGRLNASVIFGFLNLILWAGNCWFIYKETPFHKPAQPPPNLAEGGPNS